MISIQVDNVPISGLTVGQLVRPPMPEEQTLLPVHTMIQVHSKDPELLKGKIKADVHYSAFAYVDDSQ
jgi:hypothetical protein